MIIQVTGSQLWPWKASVFYELTKAYKGWLQSPYNPQALGHMLIVHGKAKRGADLFAEEAYQFMLDRGWHVDVQHFEADWDTHGKPAGMIRNREMTRWVAAQPDPVKRVLGFNYNESPGTSNCLKVARKLGLPVTEFELNLRGV